MKYILAIILIFSLSLKSQAKVSNEELAKAAKEFNIKYTILETHKEVNAYAYKGNIYITRGILDSDDFKIEGIKFVLLHEKAHVDNNHGEKTVLVFRFISTIATSVFGLSDLSITKHEFLIKSKQFMDFFVRVQEVEADDIALKTLKAKGYTSSVCYATDWAKQLDGDSVDDTHPSNRHRLLHCLKVFNEK